MKGKSVVRVFATACLALLANPSPLHAFSFFFASGGAATGDHQQAIERLVADFRQEYPDIKVELQTTTNYVRPVSETLMQELGADAPDVAIIGLVEWPILAKKNMLRSLDTVLSKAQLHKIWRELRPDAAAQSYGTKLDHKSLALPFNRGIPVLYANLKRLPGLKKPREVTWNELVRNLSGGARLAIPIDDWVTEGILLSAQGESSLRGKSVAYSDALKETLLQLRSWHESDLIYLVPSQRQAYEDFLEGKAAAVLISLSARNSVISRAKFPFRILMQPRARHAMNVIGGGDLVLPASSKRQLSERAKREIGTFLEWFYLGPGTARWARLASMYPLTRGATQDREYQRHLAERPEDQSVFRNPDRWGTRSFYELDEFCQILKIRQAAQNGFKAALFNPDLAESLARLRSVIETILKDPVCP